MIYTLKPDDDYTQKIEEYLSLKTKTQLSILDLDRHDNEDIVYIVYTTNRIIESLNNTKDIRDFLSDMETNRYKNFIIAPEGRYYLAITYYLDDYINANGENLAALLNAYKSLCILQSIHYFKKRSKKQEVILKTLRIKQEKFTESIKIRLLNLTKAIDTDLPNSNFKTFIQLLNHFIKIDYEFCKLKHINAYNKEELTDYKSSTGQRHGTMNHSRSYQGRKIRGFIIEYLEGLITDPDVNPYGDISRFTPAHAKKAKYYLAMLKGYCIEDQENFHNERNKNWLNYNAPTPIKKPI